MTDTLKDRCWRIHLEAGNEAEIVSVLTRVASKEGLRVDPEIIDLIAQQSHGSYRQAIHLLQSAVDTFKDGLNIEKLNQYFLRPPKESIRAWYETIRSQDWDQCLNTLHLLQKYSPEHCLHMILEEYPLKDRPTLETVREYNAFAGAIMHALKNLRSGIKPNMILILMSMELITDEVFSSKPLIDSGSSKLNDH